MAGMRWEHRKEVLEMATWELRHGPAHGEEGGTMRAHGRW